MTHGWGPWRPPADPTPEPQVDEWYLEVSRKFQHGEISLDEALRLIDERKEQQERDKQP